MDPATFIGELIVGAIVMLFTAWALIKTVEVLYFKWRYCKTVYNRWFDSQVEQRITQMKRSGQWPHERVQEDFEE